MHKFTKIFIAAAAVVVAALVGWYALQSYGFNHPKIEVTFVTVDGEGGSYTVPQFTLEENSSWGVSEEWDSRYFEVYDVIDKMISACKSHASDSPYFFDSSVYNADGRTFFALDGYYTENGEKKDVHEEYSVDFILTEKIREH